MVTDVTVDTFDAEVLRSEQPVIVDFWAIWCRPCRAVSRELDRLAEERPNLRLVKVNTDEELELTQRYNVMTIPTIILFEAGGPRAASVGAMPKMLIARNLGLV